MTQKDQADQGKPDTPQTPNTAKTPGKPAKTKQTVKVRLSLSAQAQKYVQRDSPLETRRMAARGALPLEPLELATVLFALFHDPDAEVKERAGDSLKALPEGVLKAVLEGPAHPALLWHLAQVHEEDPGPLEALALNPAADDRTIAFLASLPHRQIVDIVSHNQERMLRCDEIVEALGANPLTSRSVIDRILSFLGVDEDKPEASPEDGPVSEADAEAALLALLGEDMAHLVRPLARETDGEDDEPAPGSLFSAIQSMTVMQKIKLARMGGKEARGLLIRDSNKVVSTAVMMSPKITESEVTTIAQSRSISEEILRMIANNRDWTKTYSIKLALTTNPKTPQAMAIQFLNYLKDRDLRNLTKSRDVPSVITVQARRLLEKKGKL